ncbi:MAG: bifunctional nuclease family protein [Thermoplasmata archaeon]|nr:MAG: bifunctional nuclease family protein [Thermoplasmata archaeon]
MSAYRKIFNLVVPFIFGVIFALVVQTSSFYGSTIPEGYIKVQVEKIEIGNKSAVVILEAEDHSKVLPIYISREQAIAIDLALNRVTTPRPMTHELTVNILNRIGGKIEYVSVDKVVEGTYYARIIVNGREVDARPSDGIALALRSNAPIYVNSDLMEERGVVIEKVSRV